MHDDEWGEEEREQLAAVPLESVPPAQLEGRVVARLRREGLLRVAFWPRRMLAVAAGIALLLIGGAVGRATAPQEAAELGRAQFALLLYEGPEFEAYSPANFASRFDEYSRWIAGLRAEGRFVGGERLDTTGLMLLPTDSTARLEPRFAASTDGFLEGLLFINARDYDDAVAIARTTPHVRYGGRIAIRRVEPT